MIVGLKSHALSDYENYMMILYGH